MKATLQAWGNGGCGPFLDVTIERGRTDTLLLVTLSEPQESVEIDGLDLWRAILALLSDPEASGLKKSPFELE